MKIVVVVIFLVFLTLATSTINKQPSAHTSGVAEYEDDLIRVTGMSGDEDDDIEEYYEDESDVQQQEAAVERTSVVGVPVVDKDIERSRTINDEKVRSILKHLVTKPNMMAGIVCLSALIILAVILLLIFAVYRIRCRHDEGSYSLTKTGQQQQQHAQQQQRSCLHAGGYGPISTGGTYSKVPFNEIYA